MSRVLPTSSDRWILMFGCLWGFSILDTSKVICVLCARVVRMCEFVSRSDSKFEGQWFDLPSHRLCQFAFPPVCITYSVIQGQFLSHHVHVVREVNNLLSNGETNTMHAYLKIWLHAIKFGNPDLQDKNIYILGWMRNVDSVPSWRYHNIPTQSQYCTK